MSADLAVIVVEGAVDDCGADLKHQKSATGRPPHLLLRPHPAVQQPLHGALRRRREERLVVQRADA